MDGAAWWENDIQSAVRPIQAKLANDSSPPLRLLKVKGTEPDSPRAAGEGREGRKGEKQRKSEKKAGRGADQGGLTASLVLLSGDGAGQRTQRKDRDEWLLNRSKELHHGQWGKLTRVR